LGVNARRISPIVTQMVSADRAAALRNKCLNLAKTCRSGSGPASERTSQSRQWDTLARFLAILSGRRRSAAAELGWIVVARGLVLEDRWKVWVHTLAGTNGDMSRFGVMHPCGVGRSTEGDQKAEGQNRTHRICSNRPTPVLMWCAGRTVAQIGHAQQAGAAREHARPLANASHLTSAIGTKRTWLYVRLESVIRAKADITCRYKWLHLASAIHRSVALIAIAHRPSAGCPRCKAFPTSQIAKNALDRASSTSNRCSWSP